MHIKKQPAPDSALETTPCCCSFPKNCSSFYLLLVRTHFLVVFNNRRFLCSTMSMKRTTNRMNTSNSSGADRSHFYKNWHQQQSPGIVSHCSIETRKPAASFSAISKCRKESTTCKLLPPCITALAELLHRLPGFVCCRSSISLSMLPSQYWAPWCAGYNLSQCGPPTMATTLN